jgi:hypothetical protein
VARIEASLVANGFKVTRDSVSGRRALIGRSGGLRLGRRQLFVLVAVFKAGMAGREHLDRYLDEAGQYAATVKGGLAAGATAVAVAVVEPGGPDEPAPWARTPPGRPGAGRATAFPALVDLTGGRVVCPDTPAGLRTLTIRAVGLDPG